MGGADKVGGGVEEVRVRVRIEGVDERDRKGFEGSRSVGRSDGGDEIGEVG